MDLAELRAVIRGDLAAKGHASDRPTVLTFRLGQYASARHTRLPLLVVYRVLDLVWTRTIVEGITVGDRARIGAGAVVVRDVESDASAVGVPARTL